MESLLCEHLEPFSETWPTEGTMLNGQVFELPTQAHRITGLESSLLPTVTASDKADRQRSENWHGNDLVSTVKADIPRLGTPRSSAANGPTAKQVAAGAPKARLEDQVESSAQGIIEWGKFEPAIRRWEQTIGRPAPAPTKPDGKDGAHRLSSAFTEWMMGLPDGWITDCGLSRNDELKACGNGVVPQQAELALRILLEGIAIERGGGQVNLPTPTVMDQQDGKYFRSVAIKELAKGNNRGLNLNNIVETGLTSWQDGDKFEIVEGKAVKK